MNYKKIFSKAEGIVQERQESYGDAREMHQSIADRWNNVLKEKFTEGVSLSAYDVARMMAELKAARMDDNGFHEDSLIDQINYLVIAYRLAGEDASVFTWDD
tara:strand:- start:348 stop:653 length:306 start_codon:yes stop_codon:yes gene_type:complete